MSDLAPEGTRREWKEQRSDPRVETAARVRTTIFMDDPADPNGLGKLRLVRPGFTRDLSPGGACIVLDAGLGDIPAERLVGQTVKIRLELPEPGVPHVDALGRIAWGGREQSGHVLGVQFQEIPMSDREVLERHCRHDPSPQSLLYQLWQVNVSDQSRFEDDR